MVEVNKPNTIIINSFSILNPEKDWNPDFISLMENITKKNQSEQDKFKKIIINLPESELDKTNEFLLKLLKVRSNMLDSVSEFQFSSINLIDPHIMALSLKLLTNMPIIKIKAQLDNWGNVNEAAHIYAKAFPGLTIQMDLSRLLLEFRKLIYELSIFDNIKLKVQVLEVILADDECQENSNQLLKMEQAIERWKIEKLFVRTNHIAEMDFSSEFKELHKIHPCLEIVDKGTPIPQPGHFVAIDSMFNKYGLQ